MKLEGQVALVTGASRGIGRAVALALAAEGAAVAVNYRSSEDQACAVVAEIEAAGGRAAAVQGDVADFDAAHQVVAETVTGLGGIDVLVNNAGISRDRLVMHMSTDDWLDVMKVNFGGTFNCTKAALAHFISQRRGSIVNVSSVMGERGWIGEANYAASKGAVNAFTRCCAAEVARWRIRVNAVLPGFVPTELVAELLSRRGEAGLTGQIPLRSLASVEDVARVVTFLAGPDASHMTGALVTVDGGASAMLGLATPMR